MVQIYHQIKYDDSSDITLYSGNDSIGSFFRVSNHHFAGIHRCLRRIFSCTSVGGLLRFLVLMKVPKDIQRPSSRASYVPNRLKSHDGPASQTHGLKSKVRIARRGCPILHPRVTWQQKTQPCSNPEVTVTL